MPSLMHVIGTLALFGACYYLAVFIDRLFAVQLPVLRVRSWWRCRRVQREMRRIAQQNTFTKDAA